LKQIPICEKKSLPKSAKSTPEEHALDLEIPLRAAAHPATSAVNRSQEEKET
jgi:hypothetical protein